MALTSSQRRQNIQRALSKVYARTGGVTGGLQSGASVKRGGGGGSSSSSNIVTSGGMPVILPGESTPLTRQRVEKERQTVLNRRAAQQVRNLGEQIILSLSRKVGIPAQRVGDQIIIRTSPNTAIVAKVSGGKVYSIQEKSSRQARVGTSKLDTLRLAEFERRLSVAKQAKGSGVSVKEYRKRQALAIARQAPFRSLPKSVQERVLSEKEFTPSNIKTSLLKRQGYKNIRIDKSGNITADKSGRTLLITPDGRSLVVPKGTKVNLPFLQTREQQERAKRLFNKYPPFIRFFQGLLDYPVKVVRGAYNITKVASKTPGGIKKIYNALTKLFILKSNYDSFKKNPTKLRRITFERARRNYISEKKNIVKLGKTGKEVIKLLENEETLLFTIAVAGTGVALGAAVIAPVGLTGLIASKTINTGLSVLGGYATFSQAKQTLKKPTPENLGKLAFFIIPTALSILKSFRKIGLRYRPSVKNAYEQRAFLRVLRAKNAKTILAIRRGKSPYIGTKKVSKVEAIKFIKKQNKAIDQAIKEMNWLIKNREIIKIEKFNPRTYTKTFKKLQGSYQDGIHVSTETKASKLFKSNVVSKVPKKGTIEQRILRKAGKIKQPEKLGKISDLSRFRKIMINEFRRGKVVIGGGKAMNLQISPFRRRFTFDIDGKVYKTGAKKILLAIAKKANKIYGKRFVVRKGGNPGTYKLVNIKNKKTLIELTNSEKPIPFVKNKQGIRIERIKSLLKGKADALSKIERFTRKGRKDISDVIRLTAGKVKARDIITRTSTKDKILLVVRKIAGMGKDRRRFGENHLYFNINAAAEGYGKGKAYSIIIVPKAKISKFPLKLRKLINKASRGELSVNQSTRLRMKLNKYIKANPNKFYLGPRTSALPFGEKEVVISEFSSLVKGKKYITFDRDLRKFIQVIEAGFRRPKRISLLKRFAQAYGKKPIKTLKLRLTNPDIAKVRKIRNILSKRVSLRPIEKRTFLNIFNKLVRRMLTSKKAQLKLKIQKKQKRRTPIRTIRTVRLSNVQRLRYRKELKRTANKARIRVINRNTINRALSRKSTRAAARRIIEIVRILRKGTIRKTVRTRPLRRSINRKAIARNIIRKTVNRRTTFRPITRRVIGRRRKLTKKQKRKKRRFEEEKKIRKNKKKILRRKSLQSFKYTPDIASIIYGQSVSSRSQARALLRKGRVFTGLETRYITDVPTKKKAFVTRSYLKKFKRALVKIRKIKKKMQKINKAKQLRKQIEAKQRALIRLARRTKNKSKVKNQLKITLSMIRAINRIAQ